MAGNSPAYITGKLPYTHTPTQTSGKEGWGENNNKTFMAAAGHTMGTADHETYSYTKNLVREHSIYTAYKWTQ